MNKPPSLFSSFRNAGRGIRLAFRSERSFRLQLLAALLLVVALLILPLERWERAILLLVAMVVLVLELLNSSVERIVDLAKPRLHAYAGDIKDLMAGAVLVASLFALFLAALILLPAFAAFISRV